MLLLLLLLLLLLFFFFFFVHPACTLFVASFFFPSFPASFPGLACKNLPDHNTSSRYNESHPYVSRRNMQESCQS